MNENVRTFGPENCVICGLSFTDSVEEKVTVRAKGLATLIDYSFLHKDGDLMNYLESEPEKVVVHIRCRKELMLIVHVMIVCRNRPRSCVHQPKVSVSKLIVFSVEKMQF